MLESMGLEAGLSWDLGIEGHVQVLDVLDVVADFRDRSLPHELRLPDTQLLITEAGEDETAEGTSRSLGFSLTQYGEDDPVLTHWAREHYAKDISHFLTQANLSTDRTPPQQIAQITTDALESATAPPGAAAPAHNRNGTGRARAPRALRPRPTAHPRVAPGNALRNQRTRRRDSAVPQPSRARPPQGRLRLRRLREHPPAGSTRPRRRRSPLRAALRPRRLP